MLDPETGVGAYLISGGLSGGELEISDFAMLGVIGDVTYLDLLFFFIGLLDDVIGNILGIYSTISLTYSISSGNCSSYTNLDKFIAITLITTLLLVSMVIFTGAPLIFPFLFSGLTTFLLSETGADCVKK